MGVTPGALPGTPTGPGNLPPIGPAGPAGQPPIFGGAPPSLYDPGSRSWRNNNPGNIEMRGGFAERHGAIGSDPRFAIFPNEQTGTNAQRDLLFNSQLYGGKTLPVALNQWAPKNENNQQAYRAAMGNDTSGRPMSGYSPTEQNQLLSSMREHEGWKPGTTAPGGTNAYPGGFDAPAFNYGPGQESLTGGMPTGMDMNANSGMFAQMQPPMNMPIFGFGMP